MNELIGFGIGLVSVAVIIVVVYKCGHYEGYMLSKYGKIGTDSQGD